MPLHSILLNHWEKCSPACSHTSKRLYFQQNQALPIRDIKLVARSLEIMLAFYVLRYVKINKKVELKA